MSGGGRVLAVGHVGLMARDLAGLAEFYREVVGLRQSAYHAGVVAIFEAGDVDVFLLPGEPGAADFDLAVDDVDAFRAHLLAAGVECTQAARQSAQRSPRFHLR